LAIKHGHPAGWFITHQGRIIGDFGTHGPVDDNGGVEIGYGLASPYRGAPGALAPVPTRIGQRPILG
jgi:RimJ/RimL family protein N-acetyltransferase